MIYQMLKKVKDLRGDVLSVGKGHNRKAGWLKDLENKLGNDKHFQERIVINDEKVTKQHRTMPNRKAPGKDGVQGCWTENLSNLHERIAI